MQVARGLFADLVNLEVIIRSHPEQIRQAERDRPHHQITQGAQIAVIKMIHQPELAQVIRQLTGKKTHLAADRVLHRPAFPGHTLGHEQEKTTIGLNVGYKGAH